MTDAAHNLTDERLADMEKHIAGIYSRAAADIQKTADEYFAKFAKQDDEKRKLLESGKITEEEYTAWRKNKLMYGKRFTQMKEQCAQQILRANETALAYVNGNLPEVYALNYNALESSVDGVGSYSFTLVDADTVRNLATSDESLLPYREIDPEKDIPWNTKHMNAEVLQGILQGESMGDIAGRLAKVVGMDETAAIRNARTMVTSAECKGRQDSYIRAQNDGIVMQRRWIATKDARTRHWHAELDGALAEVDEPFENAIGKIMYPGDPSADGANVYNCRCTIAAKVLGFRNSSKIKQSAKVETDSNGQEKKKTSNSDKTTSKSESNESKKSVSKKEAPTKINKRGLKTDYTMKELQTKSRSDLIKIAREVARKNAGNAWGAPISEEEAVRRFNLTVDGNTTNQLRKYINKYGKI